MKMASIGLLILVGVLLAATTGVMAKPATKTPFTAEQVFDEMDDPEREWVDDDGVLHSRRAPAEFSVTGGLVGTGSIVHNQNVDITTGDGDGFGSFFLDVTWGGLSGTFEGRYSGTITAGIFSADFVGHGRGGFDGMKIMGSGFPTDPTTFAITGIILSPHG